MSRGNEMGAECRHRTKNPICLASNLLGLARRETVKKQSGSEACWLPDFEEKLYQMNLMAIWNSRGPQSVLLALDGTPKSVMGRSSTSRI